MDRALLAMQVFTITLASCSTEVRYFSWLRDRS